MISNDIITTYNIRLDKLQRFVFNKDMDLKEAIKCAKKFCKDEGMKFIQCIEVEPYTIHTWQHNKCIVFDVECSSKTSSYYYEFGKILY